ncbi:MAG: hypothetical protein R6V01_00370 [Thermoplasmatota archaeon]
MNGEKEYDEDFLNYLKENEPSLYGEFREDSVNKVEDVKRRSIRSSGSQPTVRGYGTPKYHQSMEFSLTTGNGVEIKVRGENAKTKLIWVTFIVSCLTLSFLSLFILFVTGFEYPHFFTATLFFASLICPGYPIYAIKVGRVQSTNKRDFGYPRNLFGRVYHRKDEPKKFWIQIFFWFLVAFMIVGASLLTAGLWFI